ncbi:hypothetical protein M0P48_02755 [Candidatus Gracilibacteria bacterium]|nr:hypothetical protein [Candidatus Gracilibacteria bacterium]
MPVVKDKKPRKKPKGKLKFSLSEFLPKDTVYFYSFPAGEDSKFYNHVTSWEEELVAARPLICAGDKIKVITFSSTLKRETWRLFTEKINAKTVDRDQIISLPEKITAGVKNSKRNKLVKIALSTFNHQGHLLMT